MTRLFYLSLIIGILISACNKKVNDPIPVPFPEINSGWDVVLEDNLNDNSAYPKLIRKLKFKDAQKGYAVGNTSFLVSQDGGNIWNKVEIPLSVDDLYLDNLEICGDTIYVVSEKHLYKTGNDGQSWVVSDLFGDLTGADLYNMIVLDYNHIVFSINYIFNNQFYLILSSDNGGKSFELVGGNGPLMASQFFKLTSGEILAIGSGMARVSTDYGMSWTGLPNVNGGSTISGYFQYVSDDVWYRNDGHLLKTSDKWKTWDTLSKSLPNYTENCAIATHNGQEFYLRGYDKGMIFYSSNKGLNWQKVYQTSNASFSIRDLYLHDNTLFAYGIKDDKYFIMKRDI